MTTLLGSGLAWPIEVGPRGGIALASEERDVEQAIAIILSTAPGERPMRPEFGCGAHDCVFDVVGAQTLGRIDHEVRVALDRWEPRIAVEDVTIADIDGACLEIRIRYRLKLTNDVRNLVHPFYIVPAEDGP